MSTELHTAMSALRSFVRRADCRELPDLVLEFRSNDDRARFVMTFESLLKPTQFEEGRSFGDQINQLYITPVGVRVRLAVTRGS